MAGAGLLGRWGLDVESERCGVAVPAVGEGGAVNGAMSSRVPVLPRRLWKGVVGVAVDAVDFGVVSFCAGATVATGDVDPGPHVAADLLTDGEDG